MKIEKSGFLAFGIIFLVILARFWGILGAGAVYDFTGYAETMASASFLDSFSSFGYHVVQPVLSVFNYFLFQVFGHHIAAYGVFFCALTSLGILFWLQFISTLIKELPSWRPRSLLIIISVGVMIVSSPYIVEVIAYKVCQAYLISFICLGLYCWKLTSYWQNGKGSLIWLVLPLLVQLYTFDYILIYFPLTVLLYIYYQRSKKTSSLPLLMSGVAIILYFLQNRLLLGEWIGHYGTSVHGDLDIPLMMGNVVNYWMKHLMGLHFMSYDTKATLYNGYSIVKVLVILTISVVSFIVLMNSRLKRKFRNLGLLSLLGVLVLLPVSNLYFSFLMTAENDRYGFLFVPVLATLLVWIIHFINKKWIAIGIILIIAAAQLFYQTKLIHLWKENERVMDLTLAALPTTFYEEGNKIFLLNLPDNLHGTYLYRTLGKDDDLLSETYFARTGTSLGADILPVAQMNVNGVSDGVNVKCEEGIIRVDFAQYGNWWWRNGIGASNYQNEYYTFTLDGLSYSINRKEDKNFIAMYYYWDGSKWLEVDCK